MNLFLDELLTPTGQTGPTFFVKESGTGNTGWVAK